MATSSTRGRGCRILRSSPNRSMRLPRHPVGAAHALVVERIREALLLDARGVEDVDVRVERRRGSRPPAPGDPRPRRAARRDSGRRRLSGPTKVSCTSKCSSAFGEAVDRAAVAQVPHERHLQAVEAAGGLADRVEVEQRLRGVLVAAVAPVEHRHLGGLRGETGGALHGVPQDDDVAVAADDADRVREALALAERGLVGLGEAQHLPAQPQHRRLEREARARRRLVEQRRQDAALEQGLVAVRAAVGIEPARRVEHGEEVLLLEVLGRDHTPPPECPVGVCHVRDHPPPPTPPTRAKSGTVSPAALAPLRAHA